MIVKHSHQTWVYKSIAWSVLQELKKILEKIGIESFFQIKKKHTEDFGNGIQSKV